MGRLTTFNLLYPPFKSRIEAALHESQKAGYPVRPFETIRLDSRQGALFAKGRTQPGPRVTNAAPGYSYHKYGVATDVAMYRDGMWSWEPERDFITMADIFQKHGLYWLGVTGYELVHYQMAGLPKVHVLKGIYDTSGLEGVWLYLDEIYGGKK